MFYLPMFLGIFSDTIKDIMNGIRDILQGWVLSNLQDMLTTINEKTATIATELAANPMEWHGGTVFELIKNIASQVALPIAGTFFVFVVTWELISMLTSPHMGDVDIVDVLIRWLLKTLVAAWFISNSLTICGVFFEMGGDMVGKTQKILSNELNTVTNDSGQTIQKFFSDNFPDQSEDATKEEIGQLLGLGITTVILNLVMKIMGLLITVVLYSRMISIYLHCAVAPIPVSTLTNQTLSSMGIGYLKSVFALAMQGFLMMICVAIYGALMTSIFDPTTVTLDPDNGVTALSVLNKAVLECVGFSLLLVYCMFNTERVTKSIFSIQ